MWNDKSPKVDFQALGIGWGRGGGGGMGSLCSCVLYKLMENPRPGSFQLPSPGASGQEDSGELWPGEFISAVFP